MRCAPLRPELPFQLKFIELEENRHQFHIGPYVIDAYRVNHNVVCYGYSISIPRVGRFDVERARAQNVPMKAWSRLQKGETLELDGVTYTPDMVLGPDRKGLKVTYCIRYQGRFRSLRSMLNMRIYLSARACMVRTARRPRPGSTNT